MIRPAKPANEAIRLAQLERYQILDTEPEESYDDLLAIAAGICDTPMGSVSLVAADRQWFKAHRGLPATEMARDDSFCGHAILDPENMLVVTDAYDDPRFHDNPIVRGEPGIRFYAGAPLLGPTGTASGALCVMDRKPRELSAFQRQTMVSLSRQVAYLLEMRAAYRELRHHLSEREWYEQRLMSHRKMLEEQNAELTTLSHTDALTGLANRRAFNATLTNLIAGALAAASSLSVAIIDVDHFKTVNDGYGHPAGDEMLIAIARTIEAQRGDTGFVARCGGEEFALILPGADLRRAELQCELLRRAVQDLPHYPSVTVSIGVTAYRRGDDPATMYARADRSLYEAKKSGRNRVAAV